MLSDEALSCVKYITSKMTLNKQHQETLKESECRESQEQKNRSKIGQDTQEIMPFNFKVEAN